MTKSNLKDEKAKLNHDYKANIRFLENLLEEIKLATTIEEINDPHILAKLTDCIDFFKDKVKIS
ncbi:hypothetical protein QEJ31_00450 [Pigmentibacter sp. JX0631]|uniref:hypothetical protein n=1 Tax=Pigmentibacter sp. JX0631 TaxID=2976982 RepID=UPI002468248E|nr:hypothetical protein [Pigmentibacter sp. JX0631]WGL60072.1 hypothetical protein QEJ31_00450 [Pigmentibacter sp. JX0631]